MHPVVFIPSDGTSHDLNKQGPVQLLQRRLMTSIESVAYPHHHKLVGFSRIHILGVNNFCLGSLHVAALRSEPKKQLQFVKKIINSISTAQTQQEMSKSWTTVVGEKKKQRLNSSKPYVLQCVVLSLRQTVWKLEIMKSKAILLTACMLNIDLQVVWKCKTRNRNKSDPIIGNEHMESGWIWYILVNLGN